MLPPNPTEHFEGPQLDLARAIQAADFNQSHALAPWNGLNERGLKGMTPLLFALLCATDLDPARLAIVRELVRLGADVHAEFPLLSTPLEFALLAESPLFLEAMLDGGVSPDARVQKGQTPSVFLVANEHGDARLRLLVERGADVNARDAMGNTALMEALYAGQLDQVEYLLDHGADATVTDRRGVSYSHVVGYMLGGAVPGTPAESKLLGLRERIVRSEMRWPPVSPVEERARMRERGEEPVVPAGMSH